MRTSKLLFLPILPLLILLSACQLFGGNSIVGRWEMGSGGKGGVVEFYDDGTGANISSSDPFGPVNNVFTYSYDSKSGELDVIPIDNPFNTTINMVVSFESKDSIILEERGIKIPYVRKPFPNDLPAGARGRIGFLMMGKDFSLIEAKKLKSNWESDYLVISASSKNVPADKKLEEWLVSLQVEGDPKLYVLWTENGQSWGVKNVVATPKNVSKDIKAIVESESPGAIIYSVEKSTQEIEETIPWCVVYKQKDGIFKRILVAENWVIKSFSEESFRDAGCPN